MHMRPSDHGSAVSLHVGLNHHVTEDLLPIAFVRDLYNTSTPYLVSTSLHKSDFTFRTNGSL